MFKTIIAELPNLTPKQLEVVQAVLVRLGRKQEEETPPLYTALVMSLGSNIPYSRFQYTEAYKLWKFNLPLAMQFVSETWPDIQEVEKLGLLRYLLELLLEDLKRRGIPVLTSTMVRELQNLPMLFDRCFPGYRASGLSHLIVKAMVRA